MAFTSHHAKVVVGVLVTVLHLDHVARELRFACLHEISLVVLSRVACVLGPTYRQRPHRAAPSL
jgi:hypothetical protein